MGILKVLQCDLLPFSASGTLSLVMEYVVDDLDELINQMELHIFLG